MFLLARSEDGGVSRARSDDEAAGAALTRVVRQATRIASTKSSFILAASQLRVRCGKRVYGVGCSSDSDSSVFEYCCNTVLHCDEDNASAGNRLRDAKPFRSRVFYIEGTTRGTCKQATSISGDVETCSSRKAQDEKHPSRAPVQQPVHQSPSAPSTLEQR